MYDYFKEYYLQFDLSGCGYIDDFYLKWESILISNTNLRERQLSR